MHITLLLRLLLSSLLLTIYVFFILVAKRILKKHLTTSSQYYLWFSTLFILIAPILPLNMLNLNSVFYKYFNGNSLAHLGNQVLGLTNEYTSIAQNANELKDFSIITMNTTTVILNLLFLIWITGFVFMLILNLISLLNVRKLKQTLQNITNPRVHGTFNQCKKQCNIKRNIILCKSSSITSPTMFGLFKIYIVLPTNALDTLSEQELEFILLHELIHYKNKDVISNYISNLSFIY